MRLYDQINELEIQRDNYLEETRNKQSPAEERERLLKQVKEDNQEIASLERQSVISHDLHHCQKKYLNYEVNYIVMKWFYRTNEFREKIDNIEEEIRQLDLDIEENQGNCTLE